MRRCGCKSRPDVAFRFVCCPGTCRAGEHSSASPRCAEGFIAAAEGSKQAPRTRTSPLIKGVSLVGLSVRTCHQLALRECSAGG